MTFVFTRLDPTFWLRRLIELLSCWRLALEGGRGGTFPIHRTKRTMRGGNERRGSLLTMNYELIGGNRMYFSKVDA